MKVVAYIGLGANLQNPVAQVEHALAELGGLEHCRLLASSRLYLSAPVGYDGQPDFVNAVAALETGLSPRALLDALFRIEQRHGRERHFKNAPRTLDLDLLLYGDARFHEEGLTLPHPRMHGRAFVLRPLAEIAPALHLPDLGALGPLLDAVAEQTAWPLAAPCSSAAVGCS